MDNLREKERYLWEWAFWLDTARISMVAYAKTEDEIYKTYALQFLEAANRYKLKLKQL